MKHSISDPSRNRYYRVTKRFDVFALVGHELSNTFFGASRLLRPLYQVVTVVPGDEIHALFGGVFVVQQDDVDDKYHWEVTPVLERKHPFEKNYGGEPVAPWPMDCLEEIQDHRKVDRYRAKTPTAKKADLEEAIADQLHYAWV